MRQLLILLGLTLPMGIASAQTFGEITGEVKDQSGAVVPGIPVTVTNTGTNASRTTNTNDAGLYSFDCHPFQQQLGTWLIACAGRRLD